MSDFLKAHWDKTIAALNHSGNLEGVNSDALFARLMKRYSEPHRKYHTVQHLEECFTEYDAMCRVVTPSDAASVEFALFYHDAFYDVTSDLNENLSADLAGWLLTDFDMDTVFTTETQKHILATRHGSDPTSADTAIVLDIDLAILGQPEERFDEYDRQIREEYQHVPEDKFRQARARILKGFLDRPRIYSTDYFFNKYELQARQNLQRAIAALDPSLLPA